MRLLDIALAVTASARLSRLVITDDLGRWWIQEPIDRAADEYAAAEIEQARAENRPPEQPWWWRYRDGLTCPHCVGFWIAAAVVTTGAVATRRDGPAATAWRVATGALATNYVAAHLGTRLGDYENGHEEQQA